MHTGLFHLLMILSMCICVSLSESLFLFLPLSLNTPKVSGSIDFNGLEITFEVKCTDRHYVLGSMYYFFKEKRDCDT